MPKKRTASQEKKHQNETVILLHGINRNPKFLVNMAAAFEEAGYHVKNIAYPSTTMTIPEICKQYLMPAIQKSHGTIHFVGHSLGAIVIRYFLSHHKLKNLGRVVMLGPPNGGSKVADILMNISILHKLTAKYYGPAGLSLARKENLIFNQIDDKVSYPLGIIAGTNHRWVDSFSARFIFKEPNDGKVSVESTKLAGMADHIALNVPHRMGNNPEAVAQALYFIEHGHFLHQQKKSL